MLIGLMFALSLASLAQPERVLVSADARIVTYVTGDVLWSQRLGGNAAPLGSPVRVAEGMRRDVSPLREFDALSPDGSRLVFRTGHGGPYDQGELRVASLDASGRSRVKPLVDPELGARLQTFVHVAGTGAVWSADNRRVAFVALDPEQDTNLQVYVADTDAGKIERWTDDRLSKLSVTWGPHGDSLLVTATNFTTKVSLWRLLSPSNKQEILRAQGRWLSDLRLSPDGNWLIFSRDDGTTGQARVNADGSATMQDAPLPRLQYVAFTPDGSALLARRAEGMSGGVVLVNRSSGAVANLTTGDPLFSPVGIGGLAAVPVVVFTVETGASPREVRTAKLGGGKSLVDVQTIARSTGFAAADLPFKFQIFQGTAKLYLPKGNAAGSPPPLVVVPYGGYVNTFDDPNGFLEAGWLDLMRRGWAVVLPNTSCAPSATACPGIYGELELRDTQKLIDELRARGLADSRRVAVIGHTHGGSLAYYYATHSGDFCAAVAINGRADWVAQANNGDGYITQRMGGLPSQKPELYEKGSPLQNLAAVTTPILAVSGALDTSILAENEYTFAVAARSANKPVELLDFPDEGQLIVKPVNIRRLWDKTSALLDSACRPRRMTGESQ